VSALSFPALKDEVCRAFRSIEQAEAIAEELSQRVKAN